MIDHEHTRLQARREAPRSRLRHPVTYLLFSILVAVMAMGAYAIHRATIESQRQAEQQARCQVAQAEVLRQVDLVWEQRGFPSRDQQDEWRQLMEACK